MSRSKEQDFWIGLQLYSYKGSAFLVCDQVWYYSSLLHIDESERNQQIAFQSFRFLLVDFIISEMRNMFQLKSFQLVEQIINL
jgi:hypothetical protein